MNTWRIRLSRFVARRLWTEAGKESPVLHIQPFGATGAPFATLSIEHPQFAINESGRLVPGLPLTAKDCRRAGEFLYDMANWLDCNRPLET